MAGALVILFGSWKLGQAAAVTRDAQAIAIFGFVFAGPVLLVLLLSMMWLPARDRNSDLGGVCDPLLDVPCRQRRGRRPGSAGACSAMSMTSRIPLNGPMAVIAAGLAAGFAYWLVAGWSAGFWKPVFRGAEPAPPLPGLAASRRPEIH